MAVITEVWKRIPGYEYQYEASSAGGIRTIDGLAIRQVVKNGRYHAYLGEYNRCSVERLVASAFIPNPKLLPNVVFLDGNGMNCSVENLAWSN